MPDFFSLCPIFVDKCKGNELYDLRVENIDLQTHHKRTARLLLSLCALDVYLQYVCRVDGSRLLGGMRKIEQTLPTAAKNSILSASRLQGYA